MADVSPFELQRPMSDGSLAGVSCLVIGGGGFIGQHLCHALTAAGASVRVYDRGPKAKSHVPQATWFQGHLEDIVSVYQVLAGQEIVFHLAGASVPESSNRNFNADLKSSVVPTLDLLDACTSLGIKRLVFASSGGTVYGPVAQVPISETAATDPLSAYGISKLAIEKYVSLNERLHGVTGIVARIGNPYGALQIARRNQGVVAAMLDKSLRGDPIEIWGTGEVVRDFLHVADVANALLKLAIYNGEHRVFNVGSGVGRSLNEIAADIAKFLDRPISIVRKPGRPADVPVNILSNSLILRETNWVPEVDWQSGLRHFGRWLAQI
jgi:UDP-glucose 4-epimerase